MINDNTVQLDVWFNKIDCIELLMDSIESDLELLIAGHCILAMDQVLKPQVYER